MRFWNWPNYRAVRWEAIYALPPMASIHFRFMYFESIEKLLHLFVLSFFIFYYPVKELLINDEFISFWNCTLYLTFGCDEKTIYTTQMNSIKFSYLLCFFCFCFKSKRKKSQASHHQFPREFRSASIVSIKSYSIINSPHLFKCMVFMTSTIDQESSESNNNQPEIGLNCKRL